FGDKKTGIDPATGKAIRVEDLVQEQKQTVAQECSAARKLFVDRLENDKINLNSICSAVNVKYSDKCEFATVVISLFDEKIGGNICPESFLLSYCLIKNENRDNEYAELRSFMNGQLGILKSDTIVNAFEKACNFFYKGDFSGNSIETLYLSGLAKKRENELAGILVHIKPSEEDLNKAGVLIKGIISGLSTQKLRQDAAFLADPGRFLATVYWDLSGKFTYLSQQREAGWVIQELGKRLAQDPQIGFVMTSFNEARENILFKRAETLRRLNENDAALNDYEAVKKALLWQED
ncbi:MAG: hypothetical protein AAF320_03150, partial [Myxococcota bacterium]